MAYIHYKKIYYIGNFSREGNSTDSVKTIVKGAKFIYIFHENLVVGRDIVCYIQVWILPKSSR